MKKFAFVFIAAIMAAFVLPAQVRAGYDILSVPERIEVEQGQGFVLPLQFVAPIYGATLRMVLEWNKGANEPPAYTGKSARLSTSVGWTGWGVEGDLLLISAAASPAEEELLICFTTPSVGTFGFRLRGVVTDGNLNEVAVDEYFEVQVRLAGDLNDDGVVNKDDAFCLADGIVGWGGQPRWTAGSHPSADIDGNGKLDHMDLVHLLRQILGLPPLFGGPAGKIATGTNPPEVVANAQKALADLGGREGEVVDQLREMILQLVPEAAEDAASDAVGVPTAVRSSSWGQIKASMTAE